MPNAPYRPDRAIALVGPMGAGKSTVGRLLATRLALPFVDADAEIEREAGLSVADIFERHGESRFREHERRLMALLTEGPPRVIAAGGGAFVDPETRALVLSRCVAVWLDAEAATLARRIGTGARRPLLSGRHPEQALATLAATRNPIYAEAHIRIRTDAGTPVEIAGEIVSALMARAA